MWGGRGAGEGPACRIVVYQVVTLEPSRDAPRQHPVGCDEGRRVAGSFDAGLEDKRDGLSLVVGGGRAHDMDASKRIGEARAPLGRKSVFFEEALPKLGALGGAE